jgi:DNA-binding NarL/FixJ family response regulator
MKCLVIDDHPIVRFGVCQLIQNAWPQALIEEADTLEKAMQKLSAGKPDIIILDLGLPDTNGTEGVHRIQRSSQGVPILILSMNPEDSYAARLLKQGISGYLPKDLAKDELITAIKRILEGKRYVTPAMSDKLLDLLEGNQGTQAVHELLSEQEYRVMLLVASGKSTADIADMMHLSAKTVSTYTARILQKTGWKNRVELMRYCVLHQLTDKH